MLDLIFWTCVVLACAYSAYTRKMTPGLVALSSVVVYFVLQKQSSEREEEQKKQNEQQQELVEQKKAEEKLINERMQEQTREQTRELAVEEQIQHYFKRPSIDESRYTEPIEARNALMQRMSMPDRDPYTKAMGEKERFAQYAR